MPCLVEKGIQEGLFATVMGSMRGMDALRYLPTLEAHISIPPILLYCGGVLQRVGCEKGPQEKRFQNRVPWAD